MILEAGYEGGAFVRFDDGNEDGKIPTPEVIDDITRRIGRVAAAMNAGTTAEADTAGASD